MDSIPCNRGYVYHQSGTGILVLRGIVNNPTSCFARYNVEFTGNMSIPDGGEVTPIATAIVVSGEARQGSRSIYTPAAVDEYGNVTSRATVNVPKGCCFTIAVENTSAGLEGGTAPAILVQNANMTVSRIA